MCALNNFMLVKSGFDSLLIKMALSVMYVMKYIFYFNNAKIKCI